MLAVGTTVLSVCTDFIVSNVYILLKMIWEATLHCLMITVYIIHNIHSPKFCPEYCFNTSHFIELKYKIQSLLVPLYRSSWKLYMDDGVNLLCTVEFCCVTNRKEMAINCWKDFTLKCFFKRSGDIQWSFLRLFFFSRLLANEEQKESFQFADLGWCIIVLSLRVLLEENTTFCREYDSPSEWRYRELWLLPIICVKTKWVTCIHKYQVKHSVIKDHSPLQPFCVVWCNNTDI